MRGKKFLLRWEKTHKKGMIVYILKFCISIPIASLIGRYIGVYIGTRNISKIFNKQDISQDISCAMFLCLISAFIGMLSWYSNENLYNKLNQGSGKNDN